MEIALRHTVRNGLLTAAYLHPAAMSLLWKRDRQQSFKQYMSEMYRCSKTDGGLHLPIVQPQDVCPGPATFRVSRPTNTDGSMTLIESASLCQITAASDPHKVVEIGSFQGLTTYNLAINAPRAVIHTVDLPPSTLASTTVFANNDSSIIERRSGYAYLGTDVENQIKQHYGDTATFDFAGEIGGSVDLCLIDAAHSYEYVRNDTIRTLPLMKSESIMLWHDYGRNDFLTAPKDAWGVSRFLHEIRSAGVAILQGTSLGVIRLDPIKRQRLHDLLGLPSPAATGA